MKDKILSYFNSDKHYPWTITIIPGLYFLCYIYTNNYSLINSGKQFAALNIGFILVPFTIVSLLDYFIKKFIPQYRNQYYFLAYFVISATLFCYSHYLGIPLKRYTAALVIGVVSMFIIAKHYKKLVFLNVIMLGIALFNLSYFLIERILPSSNWESEISPYEALEFKKKPNIYVIQPDGYPSKTALTNSVYSYNDLGIFKDLEEKGFVFNNDYRSNYSSTLTSNAALFSMEHHYYNYGAISGELLNARNTIVGNNAVMRTLKNNGYTTHLILEHRYLLLNHPELAYDTSNISNTELDILPNYQLDKDYTEDLKSQMAASHDGAQFYFIEILQPGHITGIQDPETTAEQQREYYFENFPSVEASLNEITDYIIINDPEAIILIIADHGGFVGYNYTQESYTSLPNDEVLKQSIFHALFSSKAPSDFEDYRKDIHSATSVFPVLFSYLAERELYKENSIDNSSYHYIKEKGVQVYRYYDSKGKSVYQHILKPK